MSGQSCSCQCSPQEEKLAKLRFWRCNSRLLLWVEKLCAQNIFLDFLAELDHSKKILLCPSLELWGARLQTPICFFRLPRKESAGMIIAQMAGVQMMREIEIGGFSTDTGVLVLVQIVILGYWSLPKWPLWQQSILEMLSEIEIEGTSTDTGVLVLVQTGVLLQIVILGYWSLR